MSNPTTNAQELNESNQDGKNPSEPTSDAGDEFKAITSQEDLNRIVGAAKKQAVTKYADYGDLRAKAAKLDEIEEANKSEVQKVNDAKTTAERERDEAKAESLRLRIAAKHGISDEDADLFLNGTDEDTLTKQAERLAGRADDHKKQGNRVSTEGTNPQSKDDPNREFLRQMVDRD